MSEPLDATLALYATLVNRAAEHYRQADEEIDLDLLQYYRGKAFAFAEAADLVCDVLRSQWGYSANDAAVAKLASERMQSLNPASGSEPWL